MNEATKNVPYRLRESLFRTFETVIKTAVESFPRAVVVETKSPNNTACRLREAMESLYRYAWPSTVDTNYAKFHNLKEAKMIYVREHDSKIAIGGKEETMLKSQGDCRDSLSCSIIEQHLGEEPFPFDLNKLALDGHDSLSLICFLSANRLLSRPLLLKGLWPEVATTMENKFDILLEHKQGDEWILT